MNGNAYMRLVATLTPDEIILLDQVEQAIRKEERENTLEDVTNFVRGNINNGSLISRQIYAALGSPIP